MDRKQLNGHDSHDNYEVVPRPYSGEILNARAYTDAVPTPTESTDDFAILMQFVRILWKRKWVLAVTVALGALIAIGMTLRVICILSLNHDGNTKHSARTVRREVHSFGSTHHNAD